MKQGDVFNYDELRKSLEAINRVPDREARVVLLPGQNPGETDVDVKVTDDFPGHVTLEYDNWASRYLNKDRMSVTLEHNNVTRHDDRLSMKFLFSEGDNLELWQGRYVYPLTETFELGGHFISSKTELGREFEASDAHGSADVLGVFAVKELLNAQGLSVNLNTGFDLKNVKNYLVGSETSSDRIRVARLGLDADVDDRWGRSVSSVEWNVGIPDILEGMEMKMIRWHQEQEPAAISTNGWVISFVCNRCRQGLNI